MLKYLKGWRMKKIKVQELQITVGKTFKNCDSTVDTPCLVVFVANLIWLKLKWPYTSLGEFLVSFSQFNEVILTSSVDRFYVIETTQWVRKVTVQMETRVIQNDPKWLSMDQFVMGFKWQLKHWNTDRDLIFIRSWSDLVNSRDALFKKNPAHNLLLSD